MLSAGLRQDEWFVKRTANRPSGKLERELGSLSGATYLIVQFHFKRVYFKSQKIKGYTLFQVECRATRLNACRRLGSHSLYTVVTVTMAALEGIRQRIIRHAVEMFWMRANRAYVGQRGERSRIGRPL